MVRRFAETVLEEDERSEFNGENYGVGGERGEECLRVKVCSSLCGVTSDIEVGMRLGDRR